MLSSELTIQQVYGLAAAVRSRMLDDPDLAGIVVTHGTGTLEESAWMTDLMVDDVRPVVFTGAMRSNSNPFRDGPMNLFDAIRVSASSEAAGMGALVVLGNVIHTARAAHKSHTTATDTFQSGEFGPVGYVYPDCVYFVRGVMSRPSLYTPSPQLDVDLIKFVVGMDDRFVRASISNGAAAIVIEGSGLANVNAAMKIGIKAALAAGVVVVVCSRCEFGRTYPAYETSSSAGALQQLGCLLSSLPGPKTRITLMLALGKTRDPVALQRVLDQL